MHIEWRNPRHNRDNTIAAHSRTFIAHSHQKPMANCLSRARDSETRMNVRLRRHAAHCTMNNVRAMSAIIYALLWLQESPALTQPGCKMKRKKIENRKYAKNETKWEKKNDGFLHCSTRLARRERASGIFNHSTRQFQLRLGASCGDNAHEYNLIFAHTMPLTPFCFSPDGCDSTWPGFRFWLTNRAPGHVNYYRFTIDRRRIPPTVVHNMTSSTWN